MTAECYRELKRELLDDLRQTLPVDGVLLALHGSGVVEDLGDLEGDLLRSVREIVGNRVPVVATLGLHAHVTQAMVENADALIAWETYTAGSCAAVNHLGQRCPRHPTTPTRHRR